MKNIIEFPKKKENTEDSLVELMDSCEKEDLALFSYYLVGYFYDKLNDGHISVLKGIREEKDEC